MNGRIKTLFCNDLTRYRDARRLRRVLDPARLH